MRDKAQWYSICLETHVLSVSQKGVCGLSEQIFILPIDYQVVNLRRTSKMDIWVQAFVF